MIILGYVFSNVMIEVNWKLLVLRVLPLPVFFVKVMRCWILLYVVIFYRVMILCG